MPNAPTRNFGTIEYTTGDEFTFPEGLPGFPVETAFLPVEVADQLPLLYLQSLRTPDLCFIALPVSYVVPDYQLSPNAEDLAIIDLRQDTWSVADMLCLTLLSFAEDGTATTNLRAPLVINVKNHLGVQMIQSDDRYPICFPLEPAKEITTC